MNVLTTLNQQTGSDALRLAATVAPTPIAYLDVSERHQYVNPAYAKLFGCAVSELVGRSLESLFIPAAKQRWRPLALLVRQALMGRSVQDAELCVPVSDDIRSFENWLLTCNPIARSGAIEGIGLLLVNVTELRRSQQLLADSQARLRLANEAAGVATFWVDLVGQVVHHSPEYVKMLGEPAREVMPLDEAFATLLLPEDISTNRAIFERACDPAGDGRLRMVIRIGHRRGDKQWLAISGQVEFADTPAGRKAVRVNGACLDVTLQREGQIALERARRMTMLSTLSAGLAHDLSSPLCAASALVQAAREMNQNEAVGELLGSIHQATEECRQIITNFREFAQRNELCLEPGDLNDIVGDAVALLRVAHPAAEIALELAPTIEPIFVDAVALRRVINNLVENAIRACATAPRVTLRTTAQTGYVQLSVADNGRGMSREEQARLFEPFYTSRPHRGGTGLGMSIVQGIVARHGGEVQIDSQVDVGTTVRVRLPLAKLAALVGVAGD